MIRLLIMISLIVIPLSIVWAYEVTIKTNYGDIELELFSELTPKTVDNFVGLATGEKEWIDPNTNESKNEPFYNGLTFHRVIKDFMIQGGCPIGNGTGGPGYRFEDELYKEGEKLTGSIDTEQEAMSVFQQVIQPYYQRVQQPDSELHRIVEEAMNRQSPEPLMEYDVEFFIEKTGHEGDVYTDGELLHTVDYGTICMANSGPNTNGSQFFIVTKREGADWLNGRHTVFGKVTKGMDVVHTIENLETDRNDKPLEENMPIIEEVIVH